MEDISTYLLTQGVLGLAVLVFGVVIYRLHLRDEKRLARIEELHELRLEDARKTKETMEEIMRGHNKNIESLDEKFQIAQGAYKAQDSRR